MIKLHILIADDEKAARHGMNRALASAGYELLEAADGNEALAVIRSGVADLVFLDLNMPGLDGVSVLRELGKVPGGCEIIVVTANDSIATAVECLRHGAADYITKPFEIERIRAISRRAAARIELERQVQSLQTQLDERHAFGALVGASRPMRQLYEQMTRAARAPIDVLVCGETGTGKELIAREIHRLSDRAAGPFIAVNTAAIAASLAESELFGHVRGAFTGANADRTGVFEQAHGGTLFLDEIGDMPLEAQAKILRTLQERTVQPVGSSRSIRVDVRVVSATHQKLDESIAAGAFRQDLFYRIRGVELQVPPLRSRREDILLLASYFLERSRSLTGSPPQFAPDAIERLITYHWPGNVRELEQAVSGAAAMAPGDTISAGDLNLAQLNPNKTAPASSSSIPEDLVGIPLAEAKARLVEAFERAAIKAALEQQHGNVSAAARQLGMHRQSLQQKMAQLSIERWLRQGDLILPDKRAHRGPHPDDERLFAPDQWPQLREAVHDLSWLLSRGYASLSALKIVGDRYRLDQRQRNAVSRCSCSDENRERRRRSRVDLADVAGTTLLLDGYNVLTSIEAALAGGVILHARDSCFRDLASIHGTWRKVAETIPAVELLGRFLHQLQLRHAVWYLDKPVSNSGRLKTLLREIAATHGWSWEINLVADPDSLLRETDELIATADSAVLDQCSRWVNLARGTIEHCVPQARVIDLSDDKVAVESDAPAEC